jgi:hypothetical protein
MVVTLAITGFIMLALVQTLTQILRVSASTYNRTVLREELKNFVLEFEKDMRNARRVGECNGENADFTCEFFTDGFYRWEACVVDEPDICEVDPSNCNDRSPRNGNNERLSMCKYALSPDGSLPNNAEPITVYDYNYNLNLFRVEEISDEPIDPDDPDSESFRRVISFTAVTSHPNDRLNIDNLLRQSIVTTKNFEVLIESNN